MSEWQGARTRRRVRAGGLPGRGLPLLPLPVLWLIFGWCAPSPFGASPGAAQEPTPEPPSAPGQPAIPDPDRFEATGPTDDPELEAQVQRLASQLRCPTCQALSIADSPSELAREMEGVIRMRLQQGMTPEEVRASMVDAYGEWILLSPDPSGFNILVYLLPPGVILLGAGIIVVGIRRWLPASAPSPGESGQERDTGVPTSPA